LTQPYGFDTLVTHSAGNRHGNGLRPTTTRSKRP
jgi:hypothetical protein